MGLFSKKTEVGIDPEQKAMLEHAQARLRQKKKLYRHFVFFLAGSLLFIILNLALGIGKALTLLEIDWFVWAILIWLFFLLVHAINVFLLGSFMNKAWEDEQLQKLIAQQQKRIAQLEEEVAITHPLPEKKSLDFNKPIDPNSPL